MHPVPMTDCLDSAELRRLESGELPPNRAADALRHVDGCADCARRRQELVRQHESWVSRIRAAGAPDRLAAPATGSDELIPGYRVLGELSRGGQGVVYRALQISTHRQVAIKVLLDGHFASPAARRRFEREVEIVAGLRHPNIVAVFDSGDTRDGRRHCVMDLVEGLALDRYAAQKNLSLRERLALFAEVCDAVHFAHQNGVIHRDLKPSNILVPDDGRPRVLDFGLARPIAASGDPVATMTGVLTGTLAYMSPEAARGRTGEVGVPSDVYSLGVILYQLITGRFPYEVDGDTLTVLRSIAEAPPLPLAEALNRREPAAPVATADADLETLAAKALAKEPARRYQSAGDLARDIRHYLADEPLEARRDSALYLLRKTLRRYRLGVAVAAAFLLVLIGSLAGLSIMYARQLRLLHDTARAETAAERRFEQVRKLAQVFIFEVDPLINRLPGTTPARELLVRTGLTYLDSLAQESGGDPAFDRELADAYLRIGDVQGDPTTSNLGRPEDALESYRRAQEILARIPPAPGANLSTRRLQLFTQLKIADALAILRRRDEAHAAGLSALDEAERLSREFPENETVSGDLASALERAGGIYLSRGETARALETYQRVLEMAEQGAARRPDDLWVRRNIGSALTKLAHFHIRNGELDLALAKYDRFLEIAQALQSANPHNIVARRDVLIGLQWRGILLTELKRLDEAIDALSQGAAVGEVLLQADPDHDEARDALTTTYVKKVEAELPAGRLEDARRSALRNRELSAEQVQRLPDNPVALRALGVAIYKQAEVELAGCDNAELPAERRVAHGLAARELFGQCQELFLDMGRRGLLSASDAAVPEALAADLAGCDAKIEKLRGHDEPPHEDPAASQPAR